MMHPEAMEWCQRWGSNDHGSGLDVGGFDVNGTARPLWPNMNWTVLDIVHEPPYEAGVNYVLGDARTWQPDHTYDLVLSTELLEHVENWPACVRTMAEALARGGLMVITCAGPGREPHGMYGDTRPAVDEHYANIEPILLEECLIECGLRYTPKFTDQDLYVAAWWPI